MVGEIGIETDDDRFKVFKLQPAIFLLLPIKGTGDAEGHDQAKQNGKTSEHREKVKTKRSRQGWTHTNISKKPFGSAAESANSY